jgi:hypothetical protein
VSPLPQKGFSFVTKSANKQDIANAVQSMFGSTDDNDINEEEDIKMP